MVDAASARAPLTAAVVVATHNRSERLGRLIRALEAQVGAPPFEMVIVDDASTDDTANVLQSAAHTTSVPLTVRRLPTNCGPATARNVGWRSTQANVVAFTDDDCVPTEEWLGELVRALEQADIVQGRTEPDPAQRSNFGPFSRTMRVVSEDGYYQTCNIAYRRSWLERLGGFDEAFRHPVGEDTDLAWRAKEDGAISTFVESAVVRHDVRPSRLRAQLSDTWRWHTVPLAVRRHPGLREKFSSRYFWRRTHAPTLAAAVGIGLVLTQPRRGWTWLLATTLMAPYVRIRTHTQPLPTTGARDRIALLPAAFTADLAEVGVLLIGSIRYRTLVL